MSNSPRIRVCLIADSPLPTLLNGADGRGGGQGATWLPPLAEHLAAIDDLEVHWVYPWSGRGSADTVAWKGIQFHGFRQIHPKLDLVLGLLSTRIKLSLLLARIAPDVIHVWGSERRHSTILESWIGPSVFSLQGNLNRYRALGLLHPDWSWQRLANLEKRWVKMADVITAESPWAVEAARELIPGLDVRHVEYGVPDSFQSQQWLPVEQDPYLLVCGALEWRKGIDVLFDALELLPHRKWRIKIAGEGSMRAELESRRLPGVEFLGNLRWQKLREIMSGAWGLVVPTRADTGPTVVKEARVMGLPVIASTHGGLRDYVVHGVNGLVVDPLTSKNLAEACELLAGDYEKARSLGAGRQKEDRLIFSPAVTAKAFTEIYRELASNLKI